MMCFVIYGVIFMSKFHFWIFCPHPLELVPLVFDKILIVNLLISNNKYIVLKIEQCSFTMMSLLISSELIINCNLNLKNTYLGILCTLNGLFCVKLYAICVSGLFSTACKQRSFCYVPVWWYKLLVDTYWHILAYKRKPVNDVYLWLWINPGYQDHSWIYLGII